MKLGKMVNWRTGFVYGRFEGYHFSREMKLELQNVCGVRSGPSSGLEG